MYLKKAFTFYLHQRFLSKLLKEFIEELAASSQNSLVGLKMVSVDNQGDVSKPVLLSLFIQSVQDHFMMFRELLKAFHRLFGLHGRPVALQKRSMIMYTHELGLRNKTPKA